MASPSGPFHRESREKPCCHRAHRRWSCCLVNGSRPGSPLRPTDTAHLRNPRFLAEPARWLLLRCTPAGGTRLPFPRVSSASRRSSFLPLVPGRKTHVGESGPESPSYAHRSRTVPYSETRGRQDLNATRKGMAGFRDYFIRQVIVHLLISLPPGNTASLVQIPLPCAPANFPVPSRKPHVPPS